MTDHFRDDRLAPRADFSVESLKKIQNPDDQFPSPSFISKAMIPKLLSSKGRDRVGRVSDKAPRGMGVEGQHKGDEKVMRIPESFVCLLADAGMGSGVH